MININNSTLRNECVFDMTSLRQLIDFISESENVHISVCDISGITNCERFSLTNKNLIHSMQFCELAKSTPTGFALCMECKRICNKKAVRNKTRFSGRCIFGQYEMVYPVVEHENVVCIIYIGNLVDDTEKSIQKLKLTAKRAGTDFLKMRECLSAMKPVENNNRYALIAEFIAEYILYHYDEARKSDKNVHWAVRTAAEHIHRNFALPITLKGIARTCFINEKYLGRLFAGEYGKSFHKYLTETRLNAAAEMLVHTDESLVNIALECGFGTQSYFNFVFKKHFGITPNEYRISRDFGSKQK